MNRRQARTFAVVLAVVSNEAYANCNDVDGANGFADGTWLVYLDNFWKPVVELTELAKSARFQQKSYSFAYIINEQPSKMPRKGIVVIKTGSILPSSRNIGKIGLVRDKSKYGTDQCERYPSFEGGSVSSKSYDDYHNYGYSAETPDKATIANFHVNYSRRDSQCRRSDDDGTDNFILGYWQSNRSQFSFDKGVVSKGQYSQLVAIFFPSPAYATTVSDRKVVMKRYVANENGSACILFDAVVKQNSFIRVNDLERRFGPFRVDEQSWEWPR